MNEVELQALMDRRLDAARKRAGTGADNPGEPVTNVLRSDHDPKCHLLNYGAGPGVCDCGWAAEYNKRLRAELERVTAERDESLARLREWTLTYGAALCPTAGSADTFGDGMRAAKQQVSAIVAHGKRGTT